MAVTYQPERPEHAAPIESVLARAFGPGRFAKTSERVRERGARFEPQLSRVALDGEKVIGLCRIYTVAAGGVTLLFLGPLAVDPDAQHGGVGAALVRACVDAGRAAGANGVICVGRAVFFEAIGFSRVPEGRLTLPSPVDPNRFMWIALRPGGLDAASGPVRAPASNGR